jgi:hypothetical protein
MGGKTRLGITISVFVTLAALICAGVLLSTSSEPNESTINEIRNIVLLTDTEIRDPEIALQYGVTGYLEITYPSDSPSSLSVDRGGEINITILLHFVSYSPEVTEAQVDTDPQGPWGLRIEQSGVTFNDFVSYNLSGNITIKAGETIPVIMTIRIPEDFPSYINSIPLGAMGIQFNITIDELGVKEVAIH